MIRRAIIFSTIFFAFSWTIYAQLFGYAIWGTIVMAEGAPVEKGIEIRLETPNHSVVKILTTDEDGRFQFQNLTPEKFYLSINLDGYVRIYEAVNLQPPNNANPHVVLTLRRGVGDTTFDGTSRADVPKKEN